ncbi:MAG: response regulator [Fretibacterium sp.]|nr:response regulator [Fretibacterium sp.]
MTNRKQEIIESTLRGMAGPKLVVLSFLIVILIYYTMLHSEISKKITKSGELSAVTSAHQVDKYISTGIDIMRLACHTLDNMIRDERSKDEILDFMKNQSISVETITSGNSKGIYALIDGDFLIGSGWVPYDGYIPSSRPWYIGARASIGRITIIDPYLDAQTGKIVITLAKTLCDAKSVAAMDFSLDRLQTLTERLAAQSESDMEIILDRKYMVIAHSDQSEVGKKYLAEEGTFGGALVGKLRSSDKDSFSFWFRGANYIVYAVPVVNDWICLSVFDVTSEFRQLRNILAFTIIASLLVITVALFVTVSYNRKDRLTQLLNKKAERAAAASEAKSSFLSRMSHEIRTPINAVLGMNEMILRESSEQNIIEYSEDIRTAGNTLLGLVNDILDFSRIEARKMEIIPAAYDVSFLINDLVNMIQTKADSKGLLLKPDFDENIPKKLYGDEVRIKQVIMNILTNAVKYTIEGSVTFHIGYEKIPDEPDCVLLDVAVMDTGIGIKPEDIKKLFSEFERIEEKRNRSIEGTGLGLNIIKPLLEIMGSSLKVESEYGRGSKFSFRLKQKVVSWEPLGDYHAAFRASLLERKKFGGSFIAPDALVLMVDDAPMNLTVFRNLLKRTHIQIDMASGGREALELMREKKYDVIFLDHMMPDMDGIETLHSLKAETDNPNLSTPSVCLTANAISGAREWYLAEGFDGYLTKPINSEELEATLLRYLPSGKVLSPDEDNSSNGGDTGPSVQLPDWLLKIEEIDTRAGLKRCGGEECYLETLKIYGEGTAVNADEIESLWRHAGDASAGSGRAGDLANVTIKVHALKSMSRIIGAESLGVLAEKLESAGKTGDETTLEAELNDLLVRYRALGTALSPLYTSAGNERNEKGLPLISEKELRDAYDSIREFAAGLDPDSVNYVLNRLSEFLLPEDDRERVEQLRRAISNLDWDRINETLS